MIGADIAISMDGKGSWRDTVFVERLWRTIKYEEVYLWAYDRVSMNLAPRIWDDLLPEIALDLR